MVRPEWKEDQLRDYLSSFDLFAGNEAEGIGYLYNAWRRLLITLDLIPPASHDGARLLELGANPYFLTLLMKKFTHYELTLSNYFGPEGPPEVRGTQVVRSQRYDEMHEFAYEHFNGELEDFPYRDDTFDIVLNCEILEHLTLDPTHFLCECHRVLKPGGYLLLTTPNVLAFQNLWRLASGKNIYDLYSGYGVYGRHNREYTLKEVIDLLKACGFEIATLRLEDIYQHKGLTQWLRRARQHWRDNIFVLARAEGEPRYVYPQWLYRSMLNLRRVVRSDVVMGENDTIQLGQGWYPLERGEYAFRWTSGDTYAYLLDDPEAERLGVELCGWPERLGSTTLSIEIGDWKRTTQFSGEALQPLYFDLPEDRPREIEVRLLVTPTRVPKDLGLNPDLRELGVLVKRLWLK